MNLMNKSFGLLAIAVAAVFAASSQFALSHSFKIGDLQIQHPYASPSPPAVKVGAAYLTAIVNKGTASDKLMSASSPAAEAVEIHRNSRTGDIVSMQKQNSLEIPAGGKVEMAPGESLHLMLVGLKAPLKTGDRFPMTLVFEKAGKLDVDVVVEGKPVDHSQHKH
jgi:periplasmic copper chaperone A